MLSSISTLGLVMLALSAQLASSAPVTPAPLSSKCTTYLTFPGQDLPFAYDAGATSTLLPNAGSAQANQEACMLWAKSQGFYVATLSATSGAAADQVKCYGKNVPHFPEYKFGMYRQKVWEDEEYLGPYNVIGYDIPIRWYGTYGQGLSACDSYTVEGQGDQAKYYCKRYPSAEGATLLLAAGCPKP